MARNAIESEFRTSKMGAGGHFVKFEKKVSYWSEMARNATESDFRTSKMAAGSHFLKEITKIKIVVLIWNGKKCDTKWFLDIQNGYRRPFLRKTFTKTVARVIWMFKPNAGRLQLDINSLLVNIYIHIDSYVGNEGIYIVFAL